MFRFSQKLMKIGVILFGFSVVLYSSSMFFLSSIIYKRLSFYFNDNNKRSLLGVYLLILQYGFKNMIVGVFQVLFRANLQQNSLIYLVITEIIVLVVFVFSINAKIYIKVFKIWIFIFLNLIKILLLLTLCF